MGEIWTFRSFLIPIQANWGLGLRPLSWSPWQLSSAGGAPPPRSGVTQATFKARLLQGPDWFIANVGLGLREGVWVGRPRVARREAGGVPGRGNEVSGAPGRKRGLCSLG